jgi:hypothetical protein
MYTKFNYSPSGYFYNHEINRHLSNGNKIFSAHEKEVQKCLSQYITEDGIINGTDLKEHWFSIATVYKGNIIKNLIMDCQSYTKYRPNETTGGIFVSWRRKEELPTGA